MSARFKKVFSTVLISFMVVSTLSPTLTLAAAKTTTEKRLDNLEVVVSSLNNNYGGISILDTSVLNLIRNPSFESADGAGKPRNWNYQLSSDTGNTFRSAEGIRSNSSGAGYGLKFKGGFKPELGISQPTAKTQPERNYTLSAYVKFVNVPSGAKAKLGFWNEKDNKYGPMKEIKAPSSGTKDWVRYSTTVKTVYDHPASTKNFFPMIEVRGLSTGAVYVDDVKMEEGTVMSTFNSASSRGGSAVEMLGAGSILADENGNLYPAESGVGSLGTASARWDSLWLANDINSDGGATFAEDVAINGDDLTSDGNLTINAAGYVRIGDDGTPGTATGDDDLYVQGDLEVDATFTLGGNLTFQNGEYITNVTDDLLQFYGGGGTDNTDLTMNLDGTYPILSSATDVYVGVDEDMIFVGAQSITTSTGTLTVDSSDADVSVTSGDDILMTPTDDITATLAAGGQVVIDGATTANTTTTGVIDLNVGAGNAAVIGQDIALTQNDGATAATDAIAQNILLTANDADGDMFGLKITSAATTAAAAGSYTGILIDNAENVADTMSDAILITATTDTAITDAIDASDAEIVNALNIGANLIEGTNFDVATTGNITVQAGYGLDTNAASGTLNLGVTNATAVNLASDATAADVITIGNSNASTTLAITGGNDWSVGTDGAAVFLSLNLGGGAVTDILSTTSSIDFGATAANTCEDSAEIALANAAVGDSVHVGTPAAPAANSAIVGFVSSAGNVKVRRCNVSVAALADPAAETYRITVMKF